MRSAIHRRFQPGGLGDAQMRQHIDNVNVEQLELLFVGRRLIVVTLPSRSERAQTRRKRYNLFRLNGGYDAPPKAVAATLPIGRMSPNSPVDSWGSRQTTQLFVVLN